ncbi:hypothetical protein [Streptomyces cyaneofuscatus]|uniref:hypothetical protein n=1 Tax=Streptomyces cyaneofuscatus TaxID=66883 RepID=UPI0036491D4B
MRLSDADLQLYLTQFRMHANSLRIGLAQAPIHPYAGKPLPAGERLNCPTRRTW